MHCSLASQEGTLCRLDDVMQQPVYTITLTAGASISKALCIATVHSNFACHLSHCLFTWRHMRHTLSHLTCLVGPARFPAMSQWRWYRSVHILISATPCSLTTSPSQQFTWQCSFIQPVKELRPPAAQQVLVRGQNRGVWTCRYQLSCVLSHLAFEPACLRHPHSHKSHMNERH